VTIHSASGLKPADWNGKSDPYVIVKSGTFEARTKIVYSTLDPVWEEDLVFSGTLDVFLTRGLLLEVYDHDHVLKMKSDDHLGNAHVSLQELRDADSLRGEARLPTQGTLRFSVTWHRYAKIGNGPNGTPIISATRRASVAMDGDEADLRSVGRGASGERRAVQSH